MKYVNDLKVYDCPYSGNDTSPDTHTEDISRVSVVMLLIIILLLDS